MTKEELLQLRALRVEICKSRDRSEELIPQAAMLEHELMGITGEIGVLLRFRYLDGYNVAEIADMLGYSERTVRSKFHEYFATIAD